MVSLADFFIPFFMFVLPVVPPLVAITVLLRRRQGRWVSSLIWAALCVLLTQLVHSASYVASEDSGTGLPDYWLFGAVCGAVAVLGSLYFALFGGWERKAPSKRG